MYRILYVDDEPGLLDIAKLYLEQIHDFSVDTDTSAQHALHLIGEQTYDAIISDYQMPEMDGIVFLKAVRSRYGDIPFILFTGRGREEVVIAAINNGADFYLQKGGDPTAQFAELAHKIRQAVTRRHAERSLVESEKRLADIINFLPDATFAIDTDGKVIAWNRAIEEMTGITAADMLGKGEYEYAVPFYGTRRRILIDLVFEPEKETREHYTGITREKDVLIAETDLPRPRGMRRTLMGKASPLYNRKGRVVGAIESIRDITQKKETEAALQEQNRVLARMNQLSLELAAIRTQENIREFAIKTLVEMTGAIAAWFCDYDAPGHILTISHLEVTPPLLKEATRLLGKLPEDVRTTVSDDLYRKIINSRVLKFSTLTEVSFGEVSPVVSRSIQALAGIDRFYGLAYVIEGNLYGTSVLALKKGQSDPSTELLESFAHIMAVSLSRRSSEERLAASEEKFRTVADYTYGWEYWEDPDRRIIYMSPSCERISGYSAEDFSHIPRLLDSIVDPSDREAWEDHRNEAETTTTALSIDFRIVRKDGGIRWINHICHPVFDTAGHPRGRRASNRDITEKKQKDDELRAAYEQLTASQEELQGQYEELAAGERRIRESEEKFRTFMETSIDGVILFDDHGGILAWNLAAEQIFGIPAREAIGINIVDLQIRLIVPEHKNPAYVEALRSRFTSSLPELFSRDTPLVIEAEVMNARGHRMIVHQTLFPIRTSSGKRIGCILREVTEQRNAEKNLMESEAKYRELAELLPQMVFEMDLGFGVTYANQIALTTMGVADKDLEAGVSALSFIDPSDHERIRQNIEKLFRGETVANPEYTAVRSDGSTFPVMIYAAPISRSGKPAGMRGVLIDITGQKRTEYALRESELFLKETQGIARLGGWKANPHTDYLEWTDGIYTIIEAPRDYRPGLTEGMKYYAPEDIPVIREKVAACLETGAPFSLEVTIITETGKKVWTELRGLAPVIEGARSYVIGTLQDITERKLTEDTLRESEERFKTLFEKSAEAQLLLDGTGKVADCNAAFLTLFALKDKGEIRGHSPEDFAPEFQPDGTRSSERGDEIIALLMREGLARYEWAHLKHDPARTPILTEVICTLIQIAGQPMVHVSIRDITDRKKAEEALNESEQNYRGVIENLQDVFYRADAAGNITMASPSATDVFGYSSVDEVIGLNLARDIYTDTENRRDFLTAIQKTGSVKNFEAVLKKKDGSSVIVSTSAHYYHDPDGNVLGVEGIAKDITVWKHTEEALRESEEKFRAVIDQSFQFIGLMNTDGTLIVANRSALAFAGISESDVINQPFWETPWWSHSNELQKKLKDAIQRAASGETVRFEATHPAADGHLAYVDFSIKPMVDSTGRILYLIPEGRDITDRKKAEEALLKRQQQLEEITGTVPGVIYQFYARPDGTMGLYYVSSRAPEVFGISSNTGDFFERFTSQVDPRDRETLLNSINEAVRQQSPFNFEGRFVKPSGETIWFQGISRQFTRGTEIVFSGVLLDITERKRVEEALRAANEQLSTTEEELRQQYGELAQNEERLRVSEEKYRTILDTTSEWIWDLGLDGRHTYSNNAIESLLGYPVNEFLGFHAFDLMHPEDKNQVEKIFTASVKERKGWRNLVTRWQHKDGTYRYLESNATTIFNERGELTGFRGADRDITDRKLAEEVIRNSEAALREKSAMLEALFNAIPDVIGVQDLHHGIIRYNAAGYAMVGKNPGEVAGKRCFELIGHDAPCEICATSETYRTKKPAIVQKYVPELNAWLDVRSYPVLDETGEIRFIIEHLHDISSRKKAEGELQSAYQNLTATEEELRGQYEELARNEERLRESEEKYRTLVESTSDFIWEVDASGTYTYVSPQVHRILGYEPEELLGKTPFDIMPPGEADKIVVAFRQCIDAQLPIVALENKALRKDGSVVILETSGVVRTTNDGSFLGYHGIDRDITKRKQAEEELREANRKLNLLSNITRHDVANQLTAVLGYTQLAVLKKPGPAVADFLNRIESAVETIQRQIEFTKEYQELGVHAPAWFSISDLIRDARPKKVRLRCTCELLEVYADPMIGRVFFNLFDNAIRYGEKVTTITAVCKKKGEELVITFTDNGVGIPPGEKEKIFEKGYGKNTGFGLFLAREILAITGITIHETGKPGKGARFEIVVQKGAYRDKK